MIFYTVYLEPVARVVEEPGPYRGVSGPPDHTQLPARLTTQYS